VGSDLIRSHTPFSSSKSELALEIALTSKKAIFAVKDYGIRNRPLCVLYGKDGIYSKKEYF
jgi:hypothetical protein